MAARMFPVWRAGGTLLKAAIALIAPQAQGKLTLTEQTNDGAEQPVL